MTQAHEQMQRLQMMEQNMQQMNMQRQQFQAQLFEIEGALKELQNAPAAYKIVGGIMVGSDKETLKAELEGKKELLEVRVQSLEKQEKQMQEKLKLLQKEAVAAAEQE